MIRASRCELAGALPHVEGEFSDGGVGYQKVLVNYSVTEKKT